MMARRDSLLVRSFDEFVLGRREFRLQKKTGHADDPVHRGADFVAHVGQKFGFGPVADFGHFLGFKQAVLVLAAIGDVAGRQGIDRRSIDLGPIKSDFRREAATLAGNGFGLDIGHDGLIGAGALPAHLLKKAGWEKDNRRCVP